MGQIAQALLESGETAMTFPLDFVKRYLIGDILDQPPGLLRGSSGVARLTWTASALQILPSTD